MTEISEGGSTIEWTKVSSSGADQQLWDDLDLWDDSDFWNDGSIWTDISTGDRTD